MIFFLAKHLALHGCRSAYSSLEKSQIAAIPVMQGPDDDLESYEIKAERVLEEQRERVSIAPELDYIDEEDEDVQPQVKTFCYRGLRNDFF